MVVSYRIERGDPRSVEARQLIAELDEAMCALYPPEQRHLLPADDLAANDAYFLMAWDKDHPVACGSVVPLGDGAVEVKRFWTQPQTRRTGLARKILRQLEAWTRQQGYSVMRLEAGPEQPDALAFYASEGFVECGPFADYKLDPGSIFPEKSLTPKGMEHTS